MKLQDLIDKGIIIEDDCVEGVWTGYVPVDGIMLLSIDNFERINFIQVSKNGVVTLLCEENELTYNINNDMNVNVYKRVDV